MTVTTPSLRMPAAAGCSTAVRRRPSICFVAPAAYPILAADTSVPFAGGAEVQQSLLAIELARRGRDVSMISMDYGQREGERVRGVRLLKMHSPDAGLPLLRFVHPRLTSAWNAMRRADADVYYQRAGGALTGFVAAFARQHRRASLFGAAHDADFDPRLPLIRFARDKLIYRWGLRNATQVVAQSERQRTRCSETFSRDAVYIDSAYGHSGAPAAHGGVVLWVANLKRHKRPHLFVELAARLPEFRFRLIGGAVQAADERGYLEQLHSRAARLPNLELTGFVPYAQIEPQFDGAAIFVNTSIGEGFPNTFLQAWSRGMPTVSFFDPQRRVGSEAAGMVVGDLDAMAAAVRRLKTDAVAWADAGAACRRAFEASNGLDRVADAFERVIDAAAARAVARTA